MTEIEELGLTQELLEDLRLLGIIDEVALRNILIKKKFRKMTQKNLKNSGRKDATGAIRELSEIECLAEHTINTIVYLKCSRKKPINLKF